jgi:hypothetical protein
MLLESISNDNIIHGDKFAALADVEINLYASGERITRNVERMAEEPCVIFCKTDFLGDLFETIRDCPHNHILITHNSDFPIDRARYESAPECIIRWYALNTDYYVYDLIPIPSGMERPNGGGYSSDVMHITEAWKTPRSSERLAFGCMNINNNPSERQPVKDAFAGQQWVTWRDHGISHQDFLNYCRTHDFVFSPQGNGIDCHRTWEAMYCGAIPIVKRSAHTDGFVDLPMLIVENWDVITPGLLTIVKNEFSRKWFRIDALMMSYWEKIIEQERKKYSIRRA